ncbi:MAG: MEKHLA domain-containing protein [Alphaproteobacteria bacterium]|nr:MEKHLA domain-containing protein [Alphaproteobacteria bacterium]
MLPPEYLQHLAHSYQRWTGRALIPSPAGRGWCVAPGEGNGDAALTPTLSQWERELYHAPFVLVSHGVQPDPIFCYANLAAQKLWEMDFDTFTGLPSRLSAEPDAREERERLLEKAQKNGYVDDYQGVRITATGKRFRIRNCTLWNVINEQNERIGQAARFSDWEWL